MSSLAVVILNYNGRTHLENFLATVVRYSEGATVVVADNGSADSSIDFVANNFPTVKLIDNEVNLGFCGGYNLALQKVQADYYILLNNDVEVTEGWIAPLKKHLDDDSQIAAVQPKILSYHNKKLFEYAGAAGGFIDTLGYPFCRGRIFDHVEEDRGQYNDATPVFWATGACLAIRSKLFHELGGFDHDFFAHMEEIDLCWKLKRNGYKIYYEGRSVVYHVGGGTLSVSNPKKTYFNFRNGLDMLIKHQEGTQLLWKLPLRLVLDWVAGLKFLLSSPGDTWAVVRAHFYILFHIGRVLRKREKLKKQLTRFAITESYAGVLVFKYFLQGRKTYKDL